MAAQAAPPDTGLLNNKTSRNEQDTLTTDQDTPIALEARAEKEARLYSPSVERNREVIKDVFLKTMPTTGQVLEIASGTGEHGVHIARHAPALTWLPGDPDARSRASIAAWREASGLKNIMPPHDIDARQMPWAFETASLDGIVAINMIHIAPFDAARGVFHEAGRILKPGGKLFLYGPFSRKGVHTAPSNADFDRSLKAQDVQWGVRDRDEELIPTAASAGLQMEATISMPANNLSVVFIKKG